MFTLEHFARDAILAVADLSHFRKLGLAWIVHPLDRWTPCFIQEYLVLTGLVAGRGVVSFQITILKVLAGQPGGRASHDVVTRSVAILMSSGVDWSARMKRLAAHAPDLSIFSSNYVIRDGSGWQITDAGRTFLASIEVSALGPAIKPDPEPVLISDQPGDLPSNVIDLVQHLDKRRGRAAA